MLNHLFNGGLEMLNAGYVKLKVKKRFSIITTVALFTTAQEFIKSTSRSNGMCAYMYVVIRKR